MSDDRPAVYGADMIPEPIPDWARVEQTSPVAVTEAEKDETVNADVLRRALHVRMDSLVRHVRSLPPGSPVNMSDITQGVRRDIEESVERYLHVERTFRKSR